MEPLQSTDAVLHRLHEKRRVGGQPIGRTERRCVGGDLLLRLDLTIQRLVQPIRRLASSQDRGREFRADGPRGLGDLIRLRHEALVRGHLAVALAALDEEVPGDNYHENANGEDEQALWTFATRSTRQGRPLSPRALGQGLVVLVVKKGKERRHRWRNGSGAVSYFRHITTRSSPSHAVGAVTVRPLRSAPHGVPPLFPEGIVADRYRIIETIGVGGSATVFEAEDLQTGELVALKAIPAEEKLRRRARREMQAVSSLDHGAIVRMLSNAEDENYIFVSFELVRGNDLSVVLREKRLEESEILRAVAAVCDALEHAHARGVIHRDVKPGNILLREDGILKLTDFGIAQMDHPDATVDESLLGTLSYMAPEQVRGEMLTGSVDVWAAALVAYEALTRKNPYRSKNPVELAEKHRKLRLSLRSERPDLPEAVTKMIDRALDLDNQRRPLPSQLRDALLRGAVAMERGGAELDSSSELPPMEPRVRLRKRWLRAVPDLIDGHRERHERAEPDGQSQTEARLVAALTRLQPHWPVALTAVSSVFLLGALPFYPTGWPLVIALLAALVALRLPLLAGALVLAATIPLLGNLAFGLAPSGALIAVAWVLLMARDGRRVLLPLIAPLCALCFAWSLYPLLAGSSPRAYIRGAVGAAGGLAMAGALGLSGYGTPFSPTPQLATLGTQLAGADDVIATTATVAAALGFGPLVLAALWAALAITAPLVLAASGRALAVAAGLWLGLGTLTTLAIPVVLTGALFAPIPIVLGAGAAGIVIFVRSRSLDTAAEAAVDSK
ncbi:MAG: hypothetical protein CK540_06170 [Thermoleophilia bacterium]|nr:MAG: hypothetical protein CK540_06170 [Thermoleophilia bacterium]